MHGLNTIISLNSAKHGNTPLVQRGNLTANDIKQKSKSKADYMAKTRAISKTVFSA